MMTSVSRNEEKSKRPKTGSARDRNDEEGEVERRVRREDGVELTVLGADLVDSLLPVSSHGSAGRVLSDGNGVCLRE